MLKYLFKCIDIIFLIALIDLIILISFYRSNHMPQRSTFVPRIKVPHQFSNILLNRPKMGLRTVSSNSLTASLRNKFTNSARDYIKYDIGIFNKYHRTRMPRFG